MGSLFSSLPHCVYKFTIIPTLQAHVLRARCVQTEPAAPGCLSLAKDGRSYWHRLKEENAGVAVAFSLIKFLHQLAGRSV